MEAGSVVEKEDSPSEPSVTAPHKNSPAASAQNDKTKAKQVLFRYCEKHGLPAPSYSVVEHGSHNLKVFEVTVCVENTREKARARTKNEAEKQAAFLLFKSLADPGAERPPKQGPSDFTPAAAVALASPALTPIALHDVPVTALTCLRGWKACPKQRLLNFCLNVLGGYPEPAFAESGPQHDKVFEARFLWPDSKRLQQLVGIGSAKTKKEAERQCAVDFLGKLESLTGFDLNDDGGQLADLAAQQASPGPTTPALVTGALHTLSLRAERAKKLIQYLIHRTNSTLPEFLEWSTGPQHNQTHLFSIKLKDQQHTFTGQGKTKAIAQNQAFHEAERWVEGTFPAIVDSFHGLVNQGVGRSSSPSSSSSLSPFSVCMLSLTEQDRLRLSFVNTLCQNTNPPSSGAFADHHGNPRKPFSARGSPLPRKLSPGSLGNSPLPIAAYSAGIIQALQRHQLVLIIGPPACGKSTQVPQIILDSTPANIVVVEHRRLAAMSLATRVAAERGEALGEAVGFSVRFDHVFPKTAGITYTTGGAFLKLLQSDVHLLEFTHVVVDEAHQRDAETDLLLTVMRDLLPLRPELRLIIMSASLDVALYRHYFSLCPAALITIPTPQSHPVDECFLEDVGDILGLNLHSSPSGDSLYETVERLIAKLVSSLDPNTPFGILCFLPGWEEIQLMRKALINTTRLDVKKLLVVSLHSSVSPSEQQRAFESPVSGTFKVILATSIAETSLTIPDIDVVIDSVRQRHRVFDPAVNGVAVVTSWASRASCLQRKGRVGRVKGGAYYCLVPRFRLKFLEESERPKILNSDLQELSLTVKALNYGSLSQFFGRMPHPPTEEAVAKAAYSLQDLGLLDEAEQLTSLGLAVAQLPLPPSLGRMVFYGFLFRCLEPAVTLAALLASRHLFDPHASSSEIQAAKRRFLPEGGLPSDHLALLGLFRRWQEARARSPDQGDSFCSENAVSFAAMTTISKAKQQILHTLTTHGYLEHIVSPDRESLDSAGGPFLNCNSDNTHLLSSLLCCGLYPNVAVQAKKKVFRTKVQPRAIVTSSTVGERAPTQTEAQTRYFMFSEQVFTGQQATATTLFGLTEVSSLALLLLGGSINPTTNADALTMDDWLAFHLPEPDLSLLYQLRAALNSFLTQALLKRSTLSTVPQFSFFLNAVVGLLSK